jgi:hypothetical protein
VAAQLDRLTDATPGQAARVDRLTRAIDGYVHDWSGPLIALAAGNLRAARRQEASGRGKARVDAIRDRHTSGREVLRMLAFAVVENIGYRQLNDLWRMLALVDLARHKQGWGSMPRRGIGNVVPSSGDD